MKRVSLTKVAILFPLATFFNLHRGLAETQNPVEIGLDRLQNQRSFRFEWRFERPGVKGEFRGSFHSPDQIGMRGRWNFGKVREEVEYFASGDEQYEWDPEKKEWVIHPRGEETDPLLQMDRILTGEFEWIREDRIKGEKSLIYGFLPNAPFLDPSNVKRLQGEIWLDPKTFLPLRVEIFEEGDETSGIGWELLFTDYNEPNDLKIPTFRYQLVLEGKMKGVREVLLERMERGGFTDVGFQVDREKMKVGFQTSMNPEKIVEHLIAQGNLQIHLAHFPKEPVSEFVGAGLKPAPTPLSPEFQDRYGKGALLVFEGEDVTKPLILQDLLLTEAEVGEERVVFDDLSRPVLQLILTAEGEERLSTGTQKHLNAPLGVVLDGRCISAPILRKPISGRTFEILVETTLEDVEGMALRLQAGPLPEGLRIISLKKL